LVVLLIMWTFPSTRSSFAAGFSSFCCAARVTVIGAMAIARHTTNAMDEQRLIEAS
jgi:hypothetical protein